MGPAQGGASGGARLGSGAKVSTAHTIAAISVPCARGHALLPSRVNIIQHSLSKKHPEPHTSEENFLFLPTLPLPLPPLPSTHTRSALCDSTVAKTHPSTLTSLTS